MTKRTIGVGQGSQGISQAGRLSALAGTCLGLMLLQLSPARAQLSNDEAPVVVGHYTLNVTSVDEHMRFWVDTLGGEAVALGDGGAEAIRFPGVFIFLNEQAPTGPTLGTTFDHIGFAVPDVPAVAARAVEAGYTRTVGREPGPGQDQSPPTAGDYGRFEYLIGPDGVKIELVTAQEEGAPPIAHHHVHFVNRDFVGMGEWYMNALNATLRPGQTDFFFGADLPGVGYMLNFFSWLPEQELVGTSGRAVDHVGFEVRDLEAFCAGLEARGVELTEPYRIEDGLGVAVITDPWGTVVELTEGLRELY
jgi:catechol 2,3-dioxygenase-like lactoylglutathione lyase family enzyme